ncbi:MAG: DUF6599 family protein [Janthinobacterium lividum]
MGLRYGVLSSIAASALFAAFAVGSPAFAQGSQPAKTAQTAVALAPLLLPNGFGSWKSTTDITAPTAEPAFSLANGNKAALEECGPVRSAVQNYTDSASGSAGRTLHIEAVEFKDASGALAALSMLSQPGMHEVKALGSHALQGDGGILFTSGAALAVAFPATAADLPALESMESVMPKPVGSQALLPLLPTLLPTRGLTPGTLRYALGPQSYMADGGVLPANSLGWEQSGEAVTAKYNDRRGAETLTLLLYPTPTIAGAHLRNIESMLPGLGPSFAHAKARREGSMIAVASGSLSPDAAQALVENTHLRQIVSTDKAMVTPEVVETRKTFGTLANTIILSGVLFIAAVCIAIFLGGGRALIRVLQGKPAATETEFLSLHLDPQNAAPKFLPREETDRARLR